MEAVATEGQGRPVLPDSDNDRDSPEPAQYAAQAQWLYDLHNKRIEAFERRAVALLAFSGVLLALLPNVVKELDKDALADRTARAFAVVVACLLVGAAFSAVCALVARKTVVPSADALRESWRDYINGGADDPVSDFAESLLHGTVFADSPLIQIRRDADQRGKWVLRSIRFVVTAVCLLIVPVFVQVL